MLGSLNATKYRFQRHINECAYMEIMDHNDIDWSNSIAEVNIQFY